MIYIIFCVHSPNLILFLSSIRFESNRAFWNYHTAAEACNQDYVNFCVGTWWSISLMASLTLLYCKEINKDKKFDPFKRDYTFPNDEEPLLEEEHKSPTGYKVPHLPSFPVNPSYTHKGLGSRCSYFQLGMEYALSLVIVLAVGTFICYLGVTRLDDQFLTDNF